MATVRKSRGYWVLDYRDQSGRRIIQKADSKGEALDRLTEIRKALKNQSYDPARAETPLNEYAVSWLEAKRSEVKPSTFTSYEYVLRVHILPVIGKICLGRLSRGTVRAFLSRKTNTQNMKSKNKDKTLSNETVRVIHATLRAMLEDAVDDEIISTNVAKTKKGKRSLKLGKGKAERAQRMKRLIFPRADLSHLLQTAERIFTDYYPLFLCLARTGLRIGEAIGLQIGDLDFVNFAIEVQRNVVKGKVGTPKNDLTRRVDMSEQLAHVLQELVVRRKEQILRTGKSVDELADMWLFQNRFGGRLDDSKVRKVFDRILVKAKLPRRNLHFLRHSFASFLIAQGESLAYVKDQMGHSSIEVTVDIYGHLVPGANRQAVNKLDDPIPEPGEEKAYGNKVETSDDLAQSEKTQVVEKTWSHPPDSNRRPTDYESRKGCGMNQGKPTKPNHIKPQRFAC